MKKAGCKLLSVIMAAVVSFSMICPPVKAATNKTITVKEANAKIEEQYLPKKTQVKKAARKAEPAEWNRKEFNIYKFGSTEDAIYYMLTGGIKYYNQKYFKNPEKVKMTAVESGTLILGVQGDNDQAASLYDSNNKLIKKLSGAYIKADVKAGETFYVEFPRNCKEGTITAYLVENEHKTLNKNDLTFQKGESKESYLTFKMKKRGLATMAVISLVEDGGNSSFKIEKKHKGKWITIGKKQTIKFTEPGLVTYGLAKGNYRVVLKAGKEQVNTILYLNESYNKKKVGYRRGSAQKITAENVFTTGERAARWYKIDVTSTKKQKKLEFSNDVNEGGFRFDIYQKGKKKPFKTVKLSSDNDEKTVKLPKRKGTYYVKVTKRTKRTNGYYEIAKH